MHHFLLALRQPYKYYSYGCRVQRGRKLSTRQSVILPLSGCNVKDFIGTARAHFLLALRQPHGYYSYGCRVEFSELQCRVQRGRTVSARQGVILPLAGCNVKGVIGTAWAYFLLALRQPHGYYTYGCRVQRGLTVSARQGVILPLAGCNVKGVIGTARAYFLLALRQPHGYYSFGCRVQRGLTVSARQGVILAFAGWDVKSVIARHGHIS